MIAPARRASILLAPAAASVITAAPIVYAHRESFRTFVSAHGLLHTAIAERFLATGLLPGRPENPFFAGERLWYYWPFHYAAAAITRVTHLHPLYGFELIILISLCILWFASAALGQRLYGGVLPGVAIGVLALAGANPFGAAMVLGKVAVRGAAIVQDNPDYLRGVVHPILGVARYQDPNSLYGPLLVFFFNISSRPLALALLLTTVLALLAWLESRRTLVLAWMAIGMALCTASSFLVGIAAGLMLLGGLVAACWIAARTGAAAAMTGHLTGPVVTTATSLIGGWLIAAPTYYYFFLGSEEPRVRLQLLGWVLTRALLTSGPIAILAAAGVLRATGIRRLFLLSVTVAGYGLVAASVVLALPVGNEVNLANAGTVLLAVPAVGGFAPGIRWPPRTRFLAWSAAAILFLPTPCLAIYAYLHRPAIALALDGRALRRLPPQSALARAYAWIGANTASDAIFVIDPRRVVAAGGNVPELPAVTGRVVFTAQSDNYMVSPYRDAAFRQVLAIGLFDGRAETERERQYLSGFHRPVYVVGAGGGADAALAALEQRYGPAVFREGDVAIIRIR